jgi:hypothetical protein
MFSHVRSRVPALAALPVLALLAVGGAAVVAAPASQAATVQCTYTPEYPKLIVVNKPTVTFRTPVKITAAKGIDCRSDFAASQLLVHSSDVYNLSWLYNSTTASDSIYPITVVPGKYTTRSAAEPCSVTLPTDASVHPTCAVTPGSTVIKFGGKASLSATRLTGKKKSEVRLTAKAGHYNQYSTSYISTKVWFQRYYSHAWHTIHTATASGSHGAVFTYTDAHASYYRAVTATTSTVVGAVSRTVTR